MTRIDPATNWFEVSGIPDAIEESATEAFHLLYNYSVKE